MSSLTQVKYITPTRAIVTKQIDKHFGVKKDELKVKLTWAYRLTLTTDCWTAVTNDSYITITCPVMSASWTGGPVCS